MSDQETSITPERLYYFNRQEVSVNDFDAPGFVLDIGGGGEGVIGRMKGKQVIAIDSSRTELEEAPGGPLKIIMDARDLQFLDCSFPTVTAFFTLMYVHDADHERLFREVFRVLVPGGQFLLWDMDIPVRMDEAKDIAAFPLLIHLPEREDLTVGYGTFWPEQDHDLAYYLRLAESAGFEIVNRRKKDRVLFLEMIKPLPKVLPV